MTLLISNCDYLIRDATHIERNCDLLIEGNRISAIGKNLLKPQNAEILDGRNCLVMPGFINAHTHLYQNLIKGRSPGITLVPWCNQVLFPHLETMRPILIQDASRLAYLWTSLAGVEMIRGGVTSCVNMDTISPGIIRAWEDMGFRGVLAYTLANKWVPEELRANEGKMKADMLNFVAAHHHPDGLTTVFVAPSTLFLCTDDLLKWSGEIARKHDLGLQIHIAEIASEVDDLLANTGHTPVEHLDNLGLLDPRLSAVHCVHLIDHDIELLAKNDALVVHCPKSNMKLSDGIASVTKMKKEGITVALGTDGCASNDILDMWEEMRAALLLARVSTGKPEKINPQDVFEMATAKAARVARLDAGELQPGKLADLAVVDLNAAHLQPFNEYDPLNTLVFCSRAEDVRDTIINGKIVMRNRQLTQIDETSLLREAKKVHVELGFF